MSDESTAVAPEPSAGTPERDDAGEQTPSREQLRERAREARRTRTRKPTDEEQESDLRERSAEFLRDRGIDPGKEPPSRQRGKGREVRADRAEDEATAGLESGMGGDESAGGEESGESDLTDEQWRELGETLSRMAESGFRGREKETEDDPASVGFHKRETARLKSQLAEQGQLLERALEIINTGRPPQGAAQGDAEESALADEPPDFFDDQEGAIRWYIAKATEPLLKEISELRGQTQTLGTAAARDAVRNVERDYDSSQAGKGYFDRRKQYLGVYGRYLTEEVGLTPDQAREAILNSDRNVQEIAIKLRKNPAALADAHYIKEILYSGYRSGKIRLPGVEAPARPTAQPTPSQIPDPAIEAARRALDSPAAKTAASGDSGTGDEPSRGGKLNRERAFGCSRRAGSAPSSRKRLEKLDAERAAERDRNRPGA